LFITPVGKHCTWSLKQKIVGHFRFLHVKDRLIKRNVLTECDLPATDVKNVIAERKLIHLWRPTILIQQFLKMQLWFLHVKRSIFTTQSTFSH